MDLNEIKSIIKIDGGKFIIVENDKPSLVVISFEDYKKHLQIKSDQSQIEQSPSLFENTDKDSDNKKSEDADEGKSASAPAGAMADKESDDELTIDDLPL